jgi:hypothetical protein
MSESVLSNTGCESAVHAVDTVPSIRFFDVCEPHTKVCYCEYTVCTPFFLYFPSIIFCFIHVIYYLTIIIIIFSITITITVIIIIITISFLLLYQSVSAPPPPSSSTHNIKSLLSTSRTFNTLSLPCNPNNK